MSRLPLFILAPLPLFFLQPLLQRLVQAVVRQRPELFRRLGSQEKKRFLINPINLPFSFLLCPDAKSPTLTAWRKDEVPIHDAEIAGSFMTLLNMVDGQLDGDALFFNRHLKIEGDVEAVVVLRNALDDLERSVADDLAAALGPPGKAGLRALRKFRSKLHDE